MFLNSTLQICNLTVIIETDAFSSGEFLLEQNVHALLVLEINKSLRITLFELFLEVLHVIGVLLS